MPSHILFSAKVWLYPGDAVWHFISLPKTESEKIKSLQKGPRRGWGAVRVSVTIGQSTWETSVFPESKSGTYILPLKKQVRNKEGIRAGDTCVVRVSLA
jgi:hypothetical protein